MTTERDYADKYTGKDNYGKPRADYVAKIVAWAKDNQDQAGSSLFG